MSEPLIDADPETEPTAEVRMAGAASPRSPGGTLGGWGRWLAADSPALVYVGVLVAAAGFVLIGVAWAEIASTTVVGLQMPYLVSAGITGLALVMVGLLLVNIGTKRQDASARQRQTAALTDAVAQLRHSVESLDRG